MGSGAKSYMMKCGNIYQPYREESVSHRYMTLHPIHSNFLINEENFLFFFNGVVLRSQKSVDRNRDPRAKKVISEPKHFRPSGPADEFQPSIPRPKLPLPAPSSATGTGNRAESHRKSGEPIDHPSGSCYVHKSPIAADQNRPKEVDSRTNEDRRQGGSSDFSRFVLLSCVRRKICDFVDLAKRSRRNHC